MWKDRDTWILCECFSLFFVLFTWENYVNISKKKKISHLIERHKLKLNCQWKAKQRKSSQYIFCNKAGHQFFSRTLRVPIMTSWVSIWEQGTPFTKICLHQRCSSDNTEKYIFRYTMYYSRPISGHRSLFWADSLWHSPLSPTGALCGTVFL